MWFPQARAPLRLFGSILRGRTLSPSIVDDECRRLLSTAVTYCRDVDIAPLWSFPSYHTGDTSSTLPELVGLDGFTMARTRVLENVSALDEATVHDELQKESRKWLLSYSQPDLANPENLREQLSFALLYEEFSVQYDDLQLRLNDNWLGQSRPIARDHTIKGSLTDEGLVDARTEGLELEWFVKWRGKYYYYDPLLRRGFAGNILHDTVGVLRAFAKEHPEVAFAIGIDHSRVLPEGHPPRPILEFDRWWGPDWGSLDLADPVSAPGDTWLVRTWPGVLLHRGWGALSVHWRKDGIYRHLQIDEVVPPTQTCSWFGGRVATRCVHAMYDLGSKSFCHLDGAVKIACPCYYRLGWSEKRNRYIPQAVRLPKYKVFRFDGPIPTDSVPDLCTAWFRGNELILEYFQGKPYRQIWAERRGHTQLPDVDVPPTPEW